ncbi:MAG TPA: formimidoylglutamate deiminase [Bryobacteraceae bacterium]|nr:formimidoylglutamate deiminase [Bryobacteraceae bacterium]
MIVPTIKGNRAVVPGLVNAHSHAFQRVIRGRTEHRTAASTDSFWTWREAMYRAANRLSPEDVYHVSRMAFMEMLLAGITTVGEFHYLHHAPDGTPYDDSNLIAKQVIRAAQDVGIRIVLLQTAYERAGWQKPINPLQARFIFQSVDAFLKSTDALLKDTEVPIGIALHSVRALRLESLLGITDHARSRKLPIHMHVAEQPAEIEECLAEHGGRPSELLREYGILGSDFTAVHAIHLTGQEIGYLGAARSTVCACPTTERNLGDGPVPADRLLETGTRICLGTDSNAQIDVFEDARCLEYHLRMNQLSRAILPVDELFRGTTESGSNALGLTQDSGDYFIIDLNDPLLAGLDDADLITQLVFSAERSAIRDVFVRGKQVIADGRHPDQDQIVTTFRKVQKRVWD